MSALAVDAISPRNSSEGPVSALPVEMCTVQHQSLGSKPSEPFCQAFELQGVQITTPSDDYAAQTRLRVLPRPNRILLDRFAVGSASQSTSRSGYPPSFRGASCWRNSLLVVALALGSVISPLHCECVGGV
jgi:hypothetical protein